MRRRFGFRFELERGSGRSDPRSGHTSPGGETSDGNAPGIPPLDGEIVETASGLRFIDERVGDGPQPPSRTCVRLHYSSWLTDGTKLFGSDGSPKWFDLNGVIAGLTEGIGTMKVGGKRRLIIPSDLGYGANGSASIPPNATVIFDVELIDVGGEPGPPVCPD